MPEFSSEDLVPFGPIRSVIDESLINGFHDGDLFEVRIDRTRNEMTLILSVDVNDDFDDGSFHARRCQLRVTGLVFVMMESPFVCPEGFARELNDMHGLPPKKLKEVYSGNLPDGAHGYWYYMSRSNSSLFFAATGADLEWLEAPGTHA
jgi:hypothetical protein